MTLRMATPFKHPKTGMYWLRRAVPKDIQQALGKTEYLRSLGTKKPHEARALFAKALQECDAAFARARSGKAAVDVLDDQQIKQVGEAWIAHILGEDDQLRLQGLPEELFIRMGESLESALKERKADLARGIVAEDIAWAFDEFLRSHGYNIPANTMECRRVHLGMLAAWIRVLEQQRLRHQGEPIETPRAPQIGPRRLLVSGQGDPTKLSGAFDGWKAERKPSDKAWSEWSLARRRFIDVNGDVPVASLTKAHIREFKDSLLKKELSQASIKKHLSAIRTVLEWAVEGGLCEHNVAAGVTVREAKVQRETRLPYSDADLKLVFSSPVYVEGERPTAGGGEGSYWLPLMALYMGCRLEEMGQALVSDVVKVGEVLCLDINDRSDGKSVKAAASRRTIPIHPELLRLGFEKYVDTLDKDGRLFPDLKKDQFGKWTGNFSKWWGRWARSLGVKDRRKVFHSFRHSYKAACRRGGIAEETHDLLTGHTGAGVGRSYGRAEEYGPELVAQLAAASKKVKYGGAALSAVRPWCAKG